MTDKRGKLVFPKDEPPSWLFNTSGELWNHMDASSTKQMQQVVSMCLCAHITIIFKGKEAVSLRGREWEPGECLRRTHGRKGMKEREGWCNSFWLIEKVGFCLTTIEGRVDVEWTRNWPVLLPQTVSTEDLLSNSAPNKTTHCLFAF